MSATVAKVTPVAKLRSRQLLAGVFHAGLANGPAANHTYCVASSTSTITHTIIPVVTQVGLPLPPSWLGLLLHTVDALYVCMHAMSYVIANYHGFAASRLQSYHGTVTR